MAGLTVKVRGPIVISKVAVACPGEMARAQVGVELDHGVFTCKGGCGLGGGPHGGGPSRIGEVGVICVGRPASVRAGERR